MANQCLTRREFVWSAAAAPLGSLVGKLKFSEADSSQQTAGSNHLNYHPRGLFVWDSWYFTHGKEVHVIHLQKKRPGSDRPDLDGVALGHAMSSDLLTWTELPVALYPGPEGSVDDMDLFTGCTFYESGSHYLFYTARKKSERGQVQRLCVATSEDAIHWTRNPEPVIEPDGRWYQAGDCRDLIVVMDPETKEFHGFFTARTLAGELAESAVIAHAVSRDLIHWRQGPPVFAPNSFGILEEPDVFYLDGRWWMICATGNFDGVRGAYCDPYVTYGTVYASSRRIGGPYSVGDETLFMGSMEFNGFSCRTVQWNSRRYVMYTQAERQDRKDRAPGTLGCLSTPKEVKALSDGRLVPAYCALIESRIEQTLIVGEAPPQLEEVPHEMASRRFGAAGNWTSVAHEVRAVSPRSWSVRRCGPEAENFIWSSIVRLDEGRAIGLLFRDTLAVYLDFDQQCVTFTDLPMLDRLEARRLPVRFGRDYHIRIITKSEFCEVYVDDVLLLNFVRYQPQSGRLGLYIEAGRGTFKQLSAFSIRV